MKIMKHILLATTLGCVSMSALAAPQSQKTLQPECEAGFTSIVTGDFNKEPQRACLPTDQKQAVKI
ncbi:hypothetical protein C0Z01_15235 [Photobacterium kishitanii]|nr:hypothetical protein [Photobacterium kishitanii]OBU27134.1 hypothetical protein AYY22_02460 [Photobacterium kishitanii]PSW68468.1 hypothetical protein C0Z01_15235 [Photobacterium kishitanii]